MDERGGGQGPGRANAGGLTGAPGRGLGRGLGALIPRGAGGLREIALDRIAPNPDQPRLQIDPAALEELAASIREHGLIQPIVVTRGPEADTYTLVAGERRWRAAGLAGLSAVPALVKEAVDQQRLELALVENVQREDLTPLELAAAYRVLVDEHGLSQEQVAQRMGRSRAAVANTLRLLQLPRPALEALAGGAISEGHARALLGSGSEAGLLSNLARVLREGLSVRETEALVRRSGTPDSPPESSRGSERETRADPELERLADRLREALGTRVQLQPAGQGGRLVIHYYSDEQLGELVERIAGPEDLLL
jgi:ParB family chromosome partitioning protein